MALIDKDKNSEKTGLNPRVKIFKVGLKFC